MACAAASMAAIPPWARGPCAAQQPAQGPLAQGGIAAIDAAAQATQQPAYAPPAPQGAQPVQEAQQPAPVAQQGPVQQIEGPDLTKLDAPVPGMGGLTVGDVILRLRQEMQTEAGMQRAMAAAQKLGIPQQMLTGR